MVLSAKIQKINLTQAPIVNLNYYGYFIKIKSLLLRF